MWQGQSWEWHPPAGKEGVITEAELEVRLQCLVPLFSGYPEFELLRAMGHECYKFMFHKKAQSYMKDAALLIPPYVHDPHFDPMGR